MSERVPNMKRHNWPLLASDATRCIDCDGMLRDVGGYACPGKKAPAPMQASRIEIAVGDEVAWSAAGKGKVLSIYEGNGFRMVAEVEVGGLWWWDAENECFTLENTGRRGTLEVRAADLTRKGA